MLEYKGWTKCISIPIQLKEKLICIKHLFVFNSYICQNLVCDYVYRKI